MRSSSATRSSSRRRRYSSDSFNRVKFMSTPSLADPCWCILEGDGSLRMDPVVGTPQPNARQGTYCRFSPEPTDKARRPQRCSGRNGGTPEFSGSRKAPDACSGCPRWLSLARAAGTQEHEPRDGACVRDVAGLDENSSRRGRLHHVFDEQSDPTHCVHIPAQGSVGKLKMDTGCDLVDLDVVV